MNGDIAIKLIAAMVPVLTLLVGVRQGGSTRSHLAKDAELLDKLPEGPARQKLLHLIELQLTDLTIVKKRQWGWAVFAAVVVGVSIWGSYELLQLGTWWGTALAMPVIFLGLVCVYGVLDSLALKPVEDSIKPPRRRPDSVDLTETTPQPGRQGQP